MAVPVVPDFTASQFVDEDDLDDLGTAIDFMMDPPRCYAYKSVDGALTSNVWNAVNLNAEAYDSHGAHDNSTNNSRLVAPEAGLYYITAHVTIAFGTGGNRALDVRKNANAVQSGGTDLCLMVLDPPGSGAARVMASFDAELDAGDYIEVFAFQNAGGPLDLNGGEANSFLSLRWVARTVS